MVASGGRAQRRRQSGAPPARRRLFLLLLAGCALPALARVVEMRDDNFDSLTRDGATWMIDIYAPWCGHCQRLEPVWRQLAEDLKQEGVKVAKVDGTRNRVLLQRFAVEAYPSIFLLKAGQTWVYEGGRGLQPLKDFALGGHRDHKPLPFHKSPNSLYGRALGVVHSLPAHARRGFTHLKEEKGFSDLAIISGALALPLLAGGMLICLLDALYTRRPHPDDQHQHYE